MGKDYQRLWGDEESPSDKSDLDIGENRPRRPIRTHNVCLLLSLLLNIALAAFIAKEHLVSSRLSQSRAPLEYLSTKMSPYSGLSHDTQIPYMHVTDYSGKNKTLADEMWSKVDNVFAIAVPEEWAAEKGLPHTWKFPWDLDKRLYFPKVGHQLHCLKSMRAAYQELWERNETRFTHGHIEHCLDTLRQDIMCQADDTPMPSLRPVGGVGDDQLMQCKNFDKLREWIYAPERNACYRHINMFKGVQHTIERFAFCEEDSINYPVMKEYFEVHGHLEEIEDMG